MGVLFVFTLSGLCWVVPLDSQAHTVNQNNVYLLLLFSFNAKMTL